MTLNILYSAALFALPCLSLDKDLQGLRFVHVLYRHGDRMPIDTFPTDPYKDPTVWEAGWGQLTMKGKLAQFMLGEWLRNRYDGFLNSSYSEGEIYVRSTDVDRTLMSAESNLAGLYPPEDNQKWSQDLEWQPIPVHTVALADDYLLSSHANCPRFETLHDEVLRGAFMQQILNENKDLFDKVSENTGVNITDIVHLDYIYDTLFIESLYNKPLPKWTEEIFPGGKFEELRDLSFSVDTFNKEMKRLKGGPFIKETIDHFQQIENSSMEPANRKMFMYSAHDTTVANVLNSLGVFQPPMAPPYASLVMIELLEMTPGVYSVKILYRNSTEVDPYELAIPGCQILCPLDKFIELTADIIPEDIKTECGLSSGPSDETVQKVILLAASVSVLLALVVLCSVLYLVCRKRRDKETKYQRVQQIDMD